VLDKAMALLDAMETGPLALNELAAASGVPRATAHRLALALELHGMVARDGEGRFVLGPRVARRALDQVAGPALDALRDATGESAQLYVRRGRTRVCVLSLESPHGLRTIVPVGAVLPLDKGSAGKVLRGEVAGMGWAQSVEERERGVASVSAPVWRGGLLAAAVSVSGPVERTTRSPGRKYAKAVVAAARRVEEAMGWR
jgi:DNA-binding IclR family transcriptional regulator